MFVDKQISLTQQLEMRQLNSAMNRDSGVQIIVTEAGAADADPAVPSVKLPSLTTTTSVFPNSVGFSNDVIHQVERVHLPIRSRRKLSMVEFSSYVMSSTSTCVGRDELDTKVDGTTPIVTVAIDAEETVIHEPAHCVGSRAQVSTLNSTKSLRHKHQTDRTTRMLVAVLILFLVTEIPQGVMALLSGVLGNQFFTRCYSTGMGEILDLLALLNSAINFLLYCSMSRQFRRAARTQFRRLFGTLTGTENCAGRSPVNCFFRPKLIAQPMPVNISPSNPTRCTQLWIYIHICNNILLSFPLDYLYNYSFLNVLRSIETTHISKSLQTGQNFFFLANRRYFYFFIIYHYPSLSIFE